MSSQADPDLIKVTEIFLVPSSFLVAALGTADTNLHRAAVSLLGWIISSFWWVCSREALAERKPPNSNGADSHDCPRRTVILSWMSLVFVTGWFASVIIHTILWDQPLGK